ncbi:hypothetical protein [Nocardia brasiliensis]|uniref:hypothetical protein n=1 Tax=Nocardia brasiliensis TaxID=37326 RepID=UPI002454CEFA|nr:hypothetical protein [Nocardia brasiliensis]
MRTPQTWSATLAGTLAPTCYSRTRDELIVLITLDKHLERRVELALPAAARKTLLRALADCMTLDSHREKASTDDD